MSSVTFAHPLTVATVVNRKNGAYCITVESPTLITNRLPVDLWVQLSDEANFEHNELFLPRLAQIPVPLHLVGRKLRFRRHTKQPAGPDREGTAWRWTNYIRPTQLAGTGATEEVVLMSPDECLAYRLCVDTSRGPGTRNLILHCPLKFENLLPVPIHVTLAQANTKKRSGNQHVVYQRFRLKSGGRFVPPHVDVRYGMTISIKLEGSTDNGLSNLRQKHAALVWAERGSPKQPETHIKLRDDNKRPLTLEMSYTKAAQLGDPTLVSVYASHWLVNETELPLEYFDMSPGAGGAQPANHECRQWLEPEPFLWSFKKGPKEKHGKFAIGLSGKPEGKGVSLSQPEQCQHIQVKTPKIRKGQQRYRHTIVCYVTLGSGRFRRTKIVYLRHLYHIINQTDSQLAIKSTDGVNESPVHIMPGQMLPFSWPKECPSKRLKLFFDHDDVLQRQTLNDLMNWSAEFQIDTVGECWLKVAETTSGFRMLRVQVTHDTATARHIVAVHEEKTYPYRIENHLSTKLGFRQLGTDFVSSPTASTGNWQQLGSRCFVSFVWALPLGTQQLEVLVEGTRHIFSIDSVGPAEDLGPEAKLGTASSGCLAEVVIHRHTRVLRIVGSEEELTSHDAVESHARTDHRVFEARFHSLGLSLIDNAGAVLRGELLYCFIDGIHLHSGENSKEQLVEVKVASLQVADQRSPDHTAVVLGRAQSAANEPPVDAAGEPQGASHGTRDHLHLSWGFDLANCSHSTDVFSFLQLSIWPSRVSIHGDFIVALLEAKRDVSDKLSLDFPAYFGQDCADSQPGDDPPAPTISLPLAVTRAGPPQAPKRLHRVFVRSLRIHPIMFEVTLKLEGSLLNFLPPFVHSLGVAIAGVDSAPLSFSELALENVFEESEVLYRRLYWHFALQCITGCYRVIGAAGFLGNPSGLVKHAVRGVGDFFYLPARGLVKSPFTAATGFAQGTESLVGEVLVGVLQSTKGIASAASTGLDALGSGDTSEHSRKLQMLHARHSGEGAAEEGFRVGMEALAHGLTSGLTGVILEPLHGARERGLAGLLIGVERGMVGAVTRPAAGALDVLSETTSGLAHSFHQVDDALERSRAPRPFRHGRLIAPFSHAWAAECQAAEETGHDANPPAVALHVVLYGISLTPAGRAAEELAALPLRAHISLGAGQRADFSPPVYTTSGVATWGRGGHRFAPIGLLLEDHALPPESHVLSVTVMSERRGKAFPLAQFDVLLPGLGLERRWREQRVEWQRSAMRLTERSTHRHAPAPGGQERWDADEEVRLQQASSWQYSGEGEAAQEDPMAIDIGLRLQQNTAQASAKNLV